jgi:hypothetical protein
MVRTRVSISKAKYIIYDQGSFGISWDVTQVVVVVKKVARNRLFFTLSMFDVVHMLRGRDRGDPAYNWLFVHQDFQY